MSNTVPCRPKKNSRIANSPQKFRDHFTVTGLDSQPPFKRGNSTQILSRIIFNENFGENCDSLGSLSQHGIHNKKDASDIVFISCISWKISIICNI